MDLLDKDLIVQSEQRATKAAICVFLITMIIMSGATLISWKTGANTTNLILWLLATPLFSVGTAWQAHTCVLVSIETRSVRTSQREAKKC